MSTQLSDFAANQPKPTTVAAPKHCPGCGHDFHAAGNCLRGPGERCLCERNMAVSLDITPPPAVEAEPAPTVPQYIYDSLLRSYNEERARRTDGQRLISIEVTLEAILTEIKRANSAAREGAISSAAIESNSKGQNLMVKAYVGSDLCAAVDDALEQYGRFFREAKLRAEAGWPETVVALAP